MRHSITTQNIRLDVGVVSCYSSTCRSHPKRHKRGTKMEKEIWKDVPEYEGLYQVSSLGRVRSLDRVVNGRWGKTRYKGRVLKPGLSSVGYLQVCLWKDGRKKTVRIHQLVAITFLNHKRCGMKELVDHIDNDKTNNRLDNLQLVTNRENTSKDRNGYTSQYVGVSWLKNMGKWRAAIQVNGKNKTLGCFDDEYEAHLAYQKALTELKEIEYVK